MERKKILYVITKSNMGGAQRYVYELAVHFKSVGCDVAVACGGNGTLTEKLKTAGVTVFDIKSFQRDIHIGKEFTSLFELTRIIRAFHPDIVHLNSSKAGGAGALVARLLGVRNIIFTAHGWPFYERRNFLWRTVIWFFSYLTTLLAHTVIVVSKHDDVHACMPLLHHKIKMIHTGVSEIHFKSREDARRELFDETTRLLHKDDTWLVSTGEHTGNKNLLSLIQTIEELQKKSTPLNYFLTLMSDGEDRTLLEAYVREHHLSNSVAFTGFVDDARLYLKAFDIFLMPSRKEGFPYALLEAGAAGLACIASNVGGIPEIITNHETGILINPQESDSILRALESLTNDTPRDLPLIHLFGEALQKKVMAEYTLEQMYVKTEKIYEAKGSLAS